MLHYEGYISTLRICNFYSSSTATVAARKRLDVSLSYVKLRYGYVACSVFGCAQQNCKGRPAGRPATLRQPPSNTNRSPDNQILSCSILRTTFLLRFSKICLSLPEGRAGIAWERSQKQIFLVPTVMITMYCPSRGPLFSCLSV